VAHPSDLGSARVAVNFVFLPQKVLSKLVPEAQPPPSYVVVAPKQLSGCKLHKIDTGECTTSIFFAPGIIWSMISYMSSGFSEELRVNEHIKSFVTCLFVVVNITPDSEL
jgi:hypothetical protein